MVENLESINFLYANYSYTVANEEIIKARYLYFFDKLKLAFGMEQVSNMQKEETEKECAQKIEEAEAKVKDVYAKANEKIGNITCFMN